MSTSSLRIPKSLHEQIRELAKHEGISINQFLASAAAEKMAALLTEEYIEKRAKRASSKKFQRVLKKMPDVEPEEYDRSKCGHGRISDCTRPSSSWGVIDGPLCVHEIGCIVTFASTDFSIEFNCSKVQSQ